MSTIHGIQAPASNAYPAAAPKPAASRPPAPQLEFQESAVQERQEALSGRQEIGEGAGQKPGSLFSATA